MRFDIVKPVVGVLVILTIVSAVLVFDSGMGVIKNIDKPQYETEPDVKVYNDTTHVSLNPSTLSVVDGGLTGVFVELDGDRPTIARMSGFTTYYAQNEEQWEEISEKYGYDLWVEPHDPEVRDLSSHEDYTTDAIGRGAVVEGDERKYLVILSRESENEWKLYSRILSKYELAPNQRG